MSRPVLKYRIRAVRELLLAATARVLVLGLGLLPERLLIPLLAGLGRLCLKPMVARAAHTHLAMGLPHLDRGAREGIIRSMAAGFGRMVAEILLVRRQGRQYVESNVRPDDSIRHLREAMAAGRGVLVLTGHFGNWELLACWGAATLEWPAAVLGRKINNWRLNRLIDDFRSRAGAEVMDRDDPPRRMVRHLLRPGVLGIVPDQDVDVLAGEFLPFLDRPAHTSTGPAALALLSGAPIVPAFMVREQRGYRLTFHEPIRPDKTASRRDEVIRITKAWSAAVEEMIRAHPDHWAWWHNRWASTPERVAYKRSRHAMKKQERANRREVEES